MNVFFGSEPKVQGQMVGQPIPGYSGANRRIGAGLDVVMDIGSGRLGRYGRPIKSVTGSTILVFAIIEHG